ncbi:hypothetical protein JHK82_044450 [Glycine max]|nr:hypothetical protein JHK82_044450 [Glycine max]
MCMIQETKDGVMKEMVVREIWGKKGYHWVAAPSIGMSGEYKWGAKPFKFFNFWSQHPSLKKVDLESWSQPCGVQWKLYAFKEELKALKLSLKAWCKQEFQKVDSQIETIERDLNDLDAKLIAGKEVDNNDRSVLLADFWRFL